MNQEIKKQINALLDQNVYIAQIEKQLNIPAHLIAKVENTRRAKAAKLLQQKQLKKRKEIKLRNEKIIKLFKKGALQKDIAETLNVSLATIEVQLNHSGLIASRKKQTMEQKEKRTKKIAALFKKGKSIQQIEQILNVSQSIIRYALKDENLIKQQIRKQSKEIQERIKAIHKLNKKNVPKKHIAEQLNCSRAYVSHTLRGDTTYQDKKIALKTKRVNKILALKAKNKTDMEIAKTLGIATVTVKKYYLEYCALNANNT